MPTNHDNAFSAWRHTCGAALLVMAAACSQASEERPAPPSPSGAPVVNPPAPETAEAFVDATAASGVSFTTGFSGDLATQTDIPTILPSGAAVGDYDGDGDLDLFIVRGDKGPNLLYRNLGGMQFEEVAAQAGLAFTKSATENYQQSSPAMADLDGDGDLDIVIPGLDSDPTLVFANNGDGTFTDVSAGSGLETMTAEHTLSPAFGDYDLDGDLDLLFGHWGSRRDFVNGPGDTEHLWRNDTDAGGIRFTSVSIQAGIAPSILTNNDPLIPQRRFDNTFTPTFARTDDDAYPDILIVGDFNFSQVFINRGDGSFDNVTDFSVIIDGNGMGSAVGDYDNDGDLDWFVSSILAGGDPPPSLSRIGNRLYRNDFGVFVDATDEAGVADGGWGWGACFIDFDNDGDLDIYHTNGWPAYVEFGPFPTDRSRMFVSNGDGTFMEDAAGIGIDDAEQGRGVVCADFDRDGDVDILLLHDNASNAVTLWENTTDGAAHFLTVTLEGATPNTQAVGARIFVTAGGQTQTREVTLGSNFASHNPTEQYFGLGATDRIDSVRVVWPDGRETSLTTPQADQRLTVAHPDL